MSAPMTDETPAWATEVLNFWFEELGPADWFVRSDVTDAKIRDRFAGLYSNLAKVPPTVGLSPRRVLAAILVLDQFPRNMFRGSAAAFATDAIALDLARGAVRDGLDLDLDTEARLFLYLPFEHAEDVGEQARAVSLIGKLNNDEYTRFAEAHQAIIARFGRFPHRNVALGRVSTPEELAFLQQPNSSF